MTAAQNLAPAMMIGHRFRLERQLGKGGMASVWVARHTTLGIDVAIKFINQELAEHPEIASRFAQEAMAAAKIQSPHVVNIIDYGTADDGRPYIAMELLKGEDLGARLDRVTKLPLEDVVTIGVQACRGMSKAHAAGIIHRDIKPENLFLTDDEEGLSVKILDFGIAKASSADSVHQTAAGVVLGTPYYMSPEQAVGKPIDLRTDLYALGAVLFHAIAGRVPLDAPNLAEMIVAITTETPRPLSHYRSGLPAGMDAWAAKALAKDPRDRFSSAREMAEALSTAATRKKGVTTDWSTSMKLADLEKLENEALESEDTAAMTIREPILAESGVTTKPASSQKPAASKPASSDKPTSKAPSSENPVTFFRAGAHESASHLAAAPVSDAEETLYTGGPSAAELRAAVKEARDRPSSIPPPKSQPVVILAKERPSVPAPKLADEGLPQVMKIAIFVSLLVLLAAIGYALTR